MFQSAEEETLQSQAQLQEGVGAEISLVYCDDPKQGMFCKLCQKRGNAPSTARGAWPTRGIQDWNHATEHLKEHSQSKCHRDAVIHARMAEQGKEQSVPQLQCSAAAKEAEERRAKNGNIVL